MKYIIFFSVLLLFGVDVSPAIWTTILAACLIAD